MKTYILLGAAALSAGCARESMEVSAADSTIMNTADGAELDEALAGRTAGEPRSCVRSQDVRNTRSAGRDTILFDGPGNTVYVNRTSGSCPRIQPWHAVRHRTISSSLCSGELIRIFDPQTGVEYGGCSLGEFTPYRRGT